ncbi:META domain-containing protein [Halomonas sp. M20]|uniref:META domain-containing protein n=1 Tax=Halomonas sp. M20 TaxID=2763264 RepID=UPI001D0AFBA0|nr:META domain-containing protein [Halomonas sp. M20]
MRVWVALVLSVILLSGCSTPTQVESEASGEQSSSPLVGPHWVLTLIGTDQPWREEDKAYFELRPEGNRLRLSGSDGCNRLMGEAALSEGRGISISELASSRMACPGQAQSAQVSQLLSQAHRYLIDHDRLVLMGRDGRVLAGFRKTNK